jgi:hypothetical protein
MVGSQQSFLQALEDLGGTLKFYYPLTDAGPWGTSHPGGGTIQMDGGTITNNAYAGTTAVITHQAGMTAPTGDPTIEVTGSRVVMHPADLSGTYANAWVCCWFQFGATTRTSTDILILDLPNSGPNAGPQIRARPGSNQIWMSEAAATNYTLAGSTWATPTLVSVSCDYTGSDSTTSLYVNGVLIGTQVRTPLRAGPLQPPSLAWELENSGSPIDTVSTGSFAYGTGVTPTAAQWLSIYNSFKNR